MQLLNINTNKFKMITLERSTPSQREKLAMIEKWMGVKFKGCVTNKLDCQLFIDEFYEDAVDIMETHKEYYET